MWLMGIANLFAGANSDLPSKAGRKSAVDDRDLFYFEMPWQAAEREAEWDMQRGRFVDFESVRHMADALSASPSVKPVPQLEQLRAWLRTKSEGTR